MGRRLRSMPSIRRRVRIHEFHIKSIEAIYSSARGHLAHDGGHFSWWLCGVCVAAGVGVAAGGLSDDPGADVLSGRKPAGDGVLGDGSAGTAVRANTGAKPDDVDELGRRQCDYAAVLARGG